MVLYGGKLVLQKIAKIGGMRVKMEDHSIFGTNGKSKYHCCND
jgi:hypothetical protein